jgi:Fe-S cluster assembly protein SufD
MTTSATMETFFAQCFRDGIAVEKDEMTRPLREEAFSYYAAKGFPSVKDEDWKYTNVAEIAKVDWQCAPLRTKLPDDDFRPGAMLQNFRFRRNGFTALNLAFADISVIVIPRETSLEKPIELTFSAAEGEMSSPHVIMIAEAGSKATILETYEGIGRSLMNSAVQIVVEEDANLTHYRVQKDSADAYNYGVTEVTVGPAARYDLTSINLGGAISRHDIEAAMIAEGGEVWVDGLYMLSGSQHHDTHSIIDHTVPNCTSHQTYRGVLNDSSRGVFNGKVMVRENAHGTDAEQSNKNLLLSNDARVDTKPQLEIFNDDVKCSHGATVGQLEEEELFYLLTRGLPETLAKNLLTYGFAEQVINKIRIGAVKKDLDEMVLSRLDTKMEV